MKFVQLGREVLPRNVKYRDNKAVITGIKNEKFVVIMKQDRTHEIVRVDDIVLTDRVYGMKELQEESCDFFKKEETAAATNDFERFQETLKKKVAADLLREKGL